MESLFSLSGKVALVTGSSRGLGAAMAAALGTAGAQVVLNGRYRDKLEGRADELRRSGTDVRIAAFDVTDHDAATLAMERIVDEWGGLDILVNNAGIVRRGDLEQFTMEDWHEVIDVNLTSVFVLARKAAQILRRPGRIINIGSTLSVVGRGTIPSYVASKHGLVGLTKALAAELGPTGINVNAICPGYFQTEINVALQKDESFDRMVKERTPLGRWGSAEELAGSVVFLASGASSYVNGHLLVVDGGLTTTI